MRSRTGSASTPPASRLAKPPSHRCCRRAPSTGIDHGFDTYTHEAAFRTLGVAVEPALEWLSAPSDQPRFAFVHGYDAHDPYPVPALLAEHFSEHPKDTPRACRGAHWRCHPTDGPRAKGRPLPDLERHQLTAAYDASVAFADHQLGRLLYGLQQAGRLDQTLVIVLSDHGELLGEDGGLGHAHGHGDAAFRVPLVVRVPGASSGVRPSQVDRTVALSDLAPTLAERLGMSPPAGAEGTPITELLDPPTVGASKPVRAASQCCFLVRDGAWALDAVRSGATFEWSLQRDGDDTDHSAAEPERVAALRSVLGDWPEQDVDADKVSEALGTASPALREALQQGGYWSGSDTRQVAR